MRMKALKTFFGDEGSVKRGREFEAKGSNVTAYEKRGLAVVVSKQIEPSNAKLLRNKAADAGPLASPGGETGAENALSSSPQDQAQPTRRSKRSKAKPE